MSGVTAQLFTLRSRLADDFISYLTGLDGHGGIVAELDRLPLFFRGESLLIRKLFVEPTVISAQQAEKRSNRQGGSAGDRGEGEDASDSNRFALEDMARAFYEHERPAEEHETLRWRQFVTGLRREPMALIGAPGGGKTCATKHLVIESALAAAKSLCESTELCEEVEVPVWVTASALARVQQRSVPDDVPQEQRHLFEAVAALLAAHEAMVGAVLPEKLRRFFLQQLLNGRGVVVVDSLDEVPSDPTLEQRLSGTLKALSACRMRLLVTCRTKDWPQRRGLAPVLEAPIELAPLRAREHREFARRFFEGDAAAGAAFQSRVRGPGFLRETCDTPLLLTYAALLHAEHGLDAVRTSADLYGLILRRILQGKWRDEPAPEWAEEEIPRETVLTALAEMAWRLFVAQPGPNEFSHSAALVSLPEFRIVAKEDLLRDLLLLGLLVRSAPGLGGEPCYSFAHRTLFEFLAAWHVHQDWKMDTTWVGPGKPPPGWSLGESRGLLRWVLEERRPFHFEPEWLQFLSFLASLLGDASPMLEVLEKEPENLFRTTFGLQCHLLGASPCTTEEWAFKLAERWGDWGRREEWERTFVQSWFAGASALCQHPSSKERVLNGFRAALDPSRETKWSVRRDAAEALGRLGVSEARSTLEAAIDPSRESYKLMRVVAVVALGDLGVPEARSALEFALDPSRESDEFVRRVAANALGRLGVPEARSALEAALNTSRESGVSVRFNAAVALGRLGVPEARSALEAALDSSRESEEWVRLAASQALGRLGVPEARSALEAALDSSRESDEFVRRVAANALGRLGVPEARCALEAALDPSRASDLLVHCAVADELGRPVEPEVFSALEAALDPSRESNWRVRLAAAEALGRLGVPEARLALEGALDPSLELEESVRRAAAVALGRLGVPEARSALEAALDPSRESNEWVRFDVADALGRLGVPEARSALEAALDPSRETDGGVRRVAAVALGRLGFPKARAALENALDPARETDRCARRDAATALGRLGVPEVRSALEAALDPSRETERSVRRAATDALWAIVCKSENTPHFRPGGRFADSIYTIPERLMPPWLKSRRKGE